MHPSHDGVSDQIKKNDGSEIRNVHFSQRWRKECLDGSLLCVLSVIGRLFPSACTVKQLRIGSRPCLAIAEASGPRKAHSFRTLIICLLLVIFACFLIQ